MNVLIADDLTTHRLILRMTLQKLGHTFKVAEDGVQAWELFQKEYFPVVITDWQMPHMDGLELCRRIRTQPYEQYTYVIVLTTLDSKLNLLEALDAGADDFLVKPYDEQIFAARLVVAQRISNLLTEARQLQGLVPICPSCRKIRTQDDHWLDVRTFLATQTAANVVQGICPACKKAQQEAERDLVRRLRKPA